MLLRRVIEHLRKQEWMAIALDSLIVVAGVFSIQASNWNASRQDVQHAHGYLARIHGDLSADLESLDRRGVFRRQFIGHGHNAIDYADTLIELSQKAARELAANLPGENGP
jgi:hypothetical protein